MKTRIGETIGFDTSGNASGFQLYGWHRPEQGFTWTDGEESALLLPTPDAPHGFFVEMACWSRTPPGRDSQRVALKANGQAFGSVVGVTRGIYAWLVPPVRERRLVLTIWHPDAVAAGSGDPRTVALAVQSINIVPLDEPAPIISGDVRRSGLPIVAGAEDDKAAKRAAELITGVPIEQFVSQFESMGDNCEFGFLQRACGAEPPGLLRFSTAYLEKMAEGVSNGFEGLYDPDNIDPQLDQEGRHDWVVWERRYLMRYHTFIPRDDTTADSLREREIIRLRLMRRKLMEDIALARKVFVVKRQKALAQEEVVPLFLALNRRARNTLLYIVPAASGRHPPGTVEEILPGLLKAYITRFAPQTSATMLSVSAWLAVLVNAWLLNQERPGG